MWFWGGASSSSVQKEAIDVSKQDFYSPGHLLALLDSLPSFDTIDDKNRDYTIEILRQIAEVLVWGEQHNRGYFDIFCEQNVLSYFVQLADQPTVPNAIKVQLLQTLSIIVQSINRQTAVYYMFSNNYINSLLSTKFDFEDEEVASWYVSFIKSLSLLVNSDTIKLFLNERAKHFPIYSEAVKFFIAKDSMIRTHCRNVTLSIFKVQDPSLRAFLLARPVFFSHVACYLRELLDAQFAQLADGQGADAELAVQDGVCEIEEMLFYIQDIFNLAVDAFSGLLASRLLVYCYFPVIGLLGMHLRSKTERHAGNTEDERNEAVEAPDGSSLTPSSGEENSNVGSAKSTARESDAWAGDKPHAQGWIWGWGSPEDSQDAWSAGETAEGAKDAQQRPVPLQSKAEILSRSWRARAAQAMAKNLPQTQQENKGGDLSEVPDEGHANSSPASAAVIQKAQLRNPWECSSNNCDLRRRFILFFLIQTLNCVQSKKLVGPIIAALLFHRLPQPLHALLLAKAPAAPSAYANLRNPTECAGHIERFLPTEDQLTGPVGTQQPEQSVENLQLSAADQPSSEGASPARAPACMQTAALAFSERIQMLETSLEAFQSLGCFRKIDSTTDPAAAQPESTPAISLAAIGEPENLDSAVTRGRSAWCHNPFRDYLLSFLDSSELEEKQCDACVLLLGLLLHLALRHPSTNEAVLMHARMLPLCKSAALAGTGQSIRGVCAVSAPSTPDSTAAMHWEGDESECWMAPSVRGGTRQIGIEKFLDSSTSAPVTPSLLLHQQASSVGQPVETGECMDYGRLSWAFTAQMLDAIQTHLSRPFLRLITIRVVIAVFTTLITDYVLKVQCPEYRVRCIEVLMERVQQLRRSAAVATRLCLSELSDGHTIDVFWDEWEVHRAGALNASALSRDVRILTLPKRSRGGPRNTAFPPYLLVAVTDQEIERRSVQVFLLFRRLHRDLSAVFQSVETRPNDTSGVAQEASCILGGISAEPNPFESQDNKEQIKQCAGQLSLEGRNIIRCTLETSSGPATRYCVQDDKRLLLVSPSSAIPGVADIRVSHPLRNVECRLKKNNPRCMQLLVLDVTSPADGPSRSSFSGAYEKPPRMQVSLTAPPPDGEAVKERPALWELHLQFADIVRCNTVFHILQQARADVRRTLASYIDALLEEQ